MKDNLIKVNVSKDQDFSTESDFVNIIPNKQYEINIDSIFTKGQKYSGYFVVFLFDDKKIEKKRYIKWITNFSNNSTQTTIIFTNSNYVYAKIGIRINTETPLKSDVIGFIQELSSIQFKERHLIADMFDDINKYEDIEIESLTDSEESLLESKIVWLFGSPRSGTTWLGDRLLKHSQTITWNESWLGIHLGCLIDINQAMGMIHDTIDSKLIRIYDIQKINPDYFFSYQYKKIWKPILRKLILERIHSRSLSLEKTIIIKDPVSSLGSDIIMECLPKSKIIFLIRDGRDVVESRLDMHNVDSWAKLPPLHNQEERQALIDGYANMWNIDNQIIERAFNNHESNLRFFIKYEELKKNTKHELKKIYNFLNIQITNEELNSLVILNDFKNIENTEKGQGKFNRTASIGGWKKTFNQNEILLMESIMNQTLTKFGYKLETNNMIHYDVMNTDIIKENSKRFFATSGKMYECTFGAIGEKGHPHSVYLGLAFFDEFDNEILRRKKFVTNYSGELEQYVIRALAPINTKYCKLLYRINVEGAQKSSSTISLQYISSLKIETSFSMEELYDNDFDYEVEWKDFDEKQYWKITGARSYEEYKEMGKSKFDILKNVGLKPASTILDIGCGTGSLIENLQNFLLTPINYVGVDIANESIIYCKKKFPDSVFYKTNIGEIPKINRKFDFITLFSVFPHMYPDEIKNQFLQIMPFLKNDGCIIASIIETTITSTFVGTRSTIELNSNFFIDLAKSCGYTKIEKISSPYESGGFTQAVYYIHA